MLTKIRLCLLAVIAISTGFAEAATVAGTPHAFLERLYAAYAPHGKGNNFAYPEARVIVDSSLLALLHRDQIMSKGEVGALDGDPVCQCQDWGAFKVQSIQTEMKAPGHATGDVAFAMEGRQETVRFDLVLENGVWKIHDLSSKDTPSLQAYLRNYKY